VIPRKVGKRRIFFLLRLGFAVFLLVVLVSMVDLRQMGLMFASVNPEPIIAALLIMLLNYGLKTYRWAAILWVPRPDISFAQLARFNFVSIFLGEFSTEQRFCRYFRLVGLAMTGSPVNMRRHTTSSKGLIVTGEDLIRNQKVFYVYSFTYPALWLTAKA
jgi:hypothetical protein